MTEIEVHPYNKIEIIPPGTRFLVIGTAPPPRFSRPLSNESKGSHREDVKFYYGSSDNQLWSEILPKVFIREFGNCEEMIEFLADRKIWMVDILQEYRRKKFDGALDVDLMPHSFTDLKSIFRDHPTIDTLFFTGGNAEAWTRKQLAEQKLISTGSSWSKDKMPRRHEFEIEVDGDRRQFVSYALPSPSNSTYRTHGLAEKIRIYGVIRERCSS
jgi:hypothetical protein